LQKKKEEKLRRRVSNGMFKCLFKWSNDFGDIN
jgi:hypothetical protein